jgi:hypothetical protein
MRSLLKLGTKVWRWMIDVRNLTIYPSQRVHFLRHIAIMHCEVLSVVWCLVLLLFLVLLERAAQLLVYGLDTSILVRMSVAYCKHLNRPTRVQKIRSK